MHDPYDNPGKVLQFPHVEGRRQHAPAPSAPADKTQREQLLRTQADRIRTLAHDNTERLSPTDREQLARNLNSLLFPEGVKRPRGWLSDLLRDAGLAKERTDHTKRLPRYVIRDGSRSNWKDLSARLNGYLQVARAYSRLTETDEDRVLVSVCRGVGFFDSAFDKEAVGDALPYLPLQRLLRAIGEAAAAHPEVAAYFRQLTRWRWDSFNGGATWGTGIEPNEANPDEEQFYLDRLSLLPKAQLISLQEDSFTLASADASLFWAYSCANAASHPNDYEVAGLEVRADPIEVETDFGLWLVLTVNPVSGRVEPRLTWLTKLSATGHCTIAGRRYQIEQVQAPARLIGVEGYASLTVNVNECYDLALQGERDADEFAKDDEQTLPLPGIDELAELSVGTIQRLFGPTGIEPEALINESPEHLNHYFQTVRAPTEAPLETAAARVESAILYYNQGERLLEELMADIDRLSMRMQREVAQATEVHRDAERTLIDSLRRQRPQDNTAEPRD